MTPTAALDRAQAISDAILIRTGAISAQAAHPHAEKFAESNLLATLAEAFGEPLAHGRTSANAAFVAGLGTGDFKKILTDGLRVASLRKLTAHAGHRQFCARQEMPNFIPASFPSCDAAIPLTPVVEGGEMLSEITLSTTDGLLAGIRSHGANFFISRRLIENDEIELITTTFGNAAAAAARLEAKSVYALIESNPTLSDGQTMFDAGHGNIQTGALDATTLAGGIGQLRSMPLPGNDYADLGARYLLCAPELEVAARTLLKAADMAATTTVIPAPWLPAGRWYLVADPSLSPCVKLLHLRGSSGGLTLAPKTYKTTRDGIGIGLRHDFGAVAVGRVGIVRGGA